MISFTSLVRGLELVAFDNRGRVEHRHCAELHDHYRFAEAGDTGFNMFGR